MELALKLDGEELNKRKLRVQRCVKKPKGKPHSGTENRNRELKKSFPKTERNEETNIAEEHENKGNVCNIFDSDKKPEIKHTEPSKEFSQFQGQKITGNKKLKKVTLHNVLIVCSFIRLLNTMKCGCSNLKQI